MYSKGNAWIITFEVSFDFYIGTRTCSANFIPSVRKAASLHDAPPSKQSFVCYNGVEEQQRGLQHKYYLNRSLFLFQMDHQLGPCQSHHQK
jgi:hypothetical protein